jgi:hypothetical protein
VIAHRVVREKGGASGFGRLVAYILNPAKLDAATVKIANCDAETPDDAVRVTEATQRMNTRAKGDPTYHLVVSFPLGERPTPEQLLDIEAELCAAIGLGGHQRISAGHIDTDCFHVHAAISKVCPLSFRFIEPHYDKLKLAAACRRLEARHGLTRTNHGEAPSQTPPGRAADIEAHGGEASLVGWIREHAAKAAFAAVETGGSWRALHEALASCGLEVKPRGAGLVIVQRDGGVAVKASSVDRRLSLKALTKRLGAYEPRQAEAAAPKAASESSQSEIDRPVDPLTRGNASRYQRGPRQPGAAAKKLYAEFQRLRAETLEARNAAFARRREAQARGERPESAAIAAALPLQTWLAFLQTKASGGDVEALAVLRWRERRQRKAAEALLTAENPDEARQVVFANLRPYARRSGALVYRVQDGGVVVDEARRLRVEEVSAHAAFFALTLAAERFSGQALVVEGTEAFKRQLAATAAGQGLAVRFSDPALEAERQRLAAGEPFRTPAAMAEDYVARRNALRQRVVSIAHHRLWTPADAGEAVYRGRRRFADGTEALLLEKNGEVLVKPVGAAQAAQASLWRTGQAVTCGAKGRVAPKAARRGR